MSLKQRGKSLDQNSWIKSIRDQVLPILVSLISSQKCRVRIRGLLGKHRIKTQIINSNRNSLRWSEVSTFTARTGQPKYLASQLKFSELCVWVFMPNLECKLSPPYSSKYTLNSQQTDFLIYAQIISHEIPASQFSCLPGILLSCSFIHV